MCGKVIGLDLGWTLEDESESQLDRARQVAKICGEYQIDIDAIRFVQDQTAAGEKGIDSVFKYVVDVLDVPAAAKEKIRKTVKWNTSFLKLYPEVKGVLDELHEKYDLILIANQSSPVDGRLARYGILRFFKKIVCSCDVGASKPDPAIFKMAEKGYEGQDVEYWMIGDRVDNDIVPAKALGWKTVRILRGDHRRYEPKYGYETPDYTLNDLPGVADILRLGADKSQKSKE